MREPLSVSSTEPRVPPAISSQMPTLRRHRRVTSARHRDTLCHTALQDAAAAARAAAVPRATAAEALPGLLRSFSHDHLQNAYGTRFTYYWVRSRSRSCYRDIRQLTCARQGLVCVPHTGLFDLEGTLPQAVVRARFREMGHVLDMCWGFRRL